VSRALPLATAAIAALALAVSLAQPATAKTLTSSGEPIANQAGQTFRVLGHRGGALQWPENSVEAYIGAAEAGYDGIETDISFTADGAAVMSHYDKLPSRCTLAGSRIHKLSLLQVRDVRCKDLSGEFTVPIPTFDQLAEVLKAHPDVWLTLDIKSYSGQSASGKRSYAAKAVQLLQANGLLDRTRIISFNWAYALPTIRKLAPKIYVAAYDHTGFDYDRVRLAAKLGASSFGTKSRYTSVTLATYTRAKGMDSVPWDITTSQGQAMSIYYGPKTYWFITDSPASVVKKLTSGAAQLDWAPSDQVTTLPAPVRVTKKTFKAKKTYYPPILGKSVPSGAGMALKTVNLSVTITKGASKNYLYYAARSSAGSSTKKVALPKGTGTILISVPVGDGGQLRLRTSKKSKLTVSTLSYTNEVYTAIAPTTTGR
jgi:glycerophosphoryl diester phosphodiesterase